MSIPSNIPLDKYQVSFQMLEQRYPYPIGGSFEFVFPGTESLHVTQYNGIDSRKALEIIQKFQGCHFRNFEVYHVDQKVLMGQNQEWNLDLDSNYYNGPHPFDIALTWDKALAEVVAKINDAATPVLTK